VAIRNKAVHELTHRQRLIIMGSVLMALFLGALDQTVVGTALPKIVTDLGGNNLYVWVITAYLLTSTITVPIYGKLSDLYGRKRVLMIGIVIFLVGSALSGLSQNMLELIIFRGLQGLGAGALFPVSLAVIGDLFSPRERGKYQGLFGAVFGLSFLIGPFLGGYITDTISWHWVFYVNLPIGIVALITIGILLQNHKTADKIKLDFLGLGLFICAIVPILIGLTEMGLTNPAGQLNNFFSPEVGGLVLVGVVLAVAFVLTEFRTADPLLPVRLFASRSFACSNIAVFFLAFGMFAAIIFLPRYFQAALGISATASGYQIWPMLIGLMGMSVITGQLISRTGKYKWLLVATSFILLLGMWLDTGLQLGTSRLELWLWLGIIGFGLGPSMSGYTLIVQGTTHREQLGVATSTVTFMRQIGGTVGLAIAGALFASHFATELPQKLHTLHVSPKLAQAVIKANASSLTGVTSSSNTLKHLPASILLAAHQALSSAIGAAFWLGVIAAAIGLILAFLLPELPLRTTSAHGDIAATPN
jgi:EmrB/QacA subfamily drug resistance transporter